MTVPTVSVTLPTMPLLLLDEPALEPVRLEDEPVRERELVRLEDEPVREPELRDPFCREPPDFVPLRDREPAPLARDRPEACAALLVGLLGEVARFAGEVFALPAVAGLELLERALDERFAESAMIASLSGLPGCTRWNVPARSRAGKDGSALQVFGAASIVEMATYSQAWRAMNSSVPPVSPPLITAALIRMPRITATMPKNSVVLNECLVSVPSRCELRAAGG
jgi:hypothetical protein